MSGVKTEFRRRTFRLFAGFIILFKHILQFFLASNKKCCTFARDLRPSLRRDGRVVDYSSLENCRAERHRGFESLSLRNKR